MDPNVWHIEMFGRLRARRGDQVITHFKTYKAGALLAYLANAEQPGYRREELIDLLWPDDPRYAGQVSLRVALHTLRERMEGPEEKAEELLVSNRVSIYLNPNAYTTDKAEFEDNLKRSMRTENEDEQMACLMRAIELYRGVFMLYYEEAWIGEERQRLADAYLMALRRLIKLLVKRHEYDVAIEYARRAIQADPLREESHRTLMRLYVQTGRPAAAMDQYQELEVILERKLRKPPSKLTQQLVEQFSRLGGTDTASPPVTGALLASVPAAALPSEPESETARETVAGNVPAQTTPFFGREDALETIPQMLQTPETRLVTLTGVPGSGKTRLAQAVALRLQSVYPGGVWWVPLAPLSDPALIPDAIGQALSLQSTPETPRFQQVAEALSARPTLLVLDNIEHLLPEGAQTITALLEAVPHLTCLITSRQRLRLTSEYEYLVKSLPVPGEWEPLNRIGETAGAQLFLDRAKSVYPEFRVTPYNAGAIGEICRRLEGLPLALELAAAWVQTLSPAQILDRLVPRFKLLVSRNSDISPRHVSLRAALDWSFDLLEPEVQEFFAALSVFRGGWTLEAAEIVTQEPNALEYLTQLRERSLLTTTETDGERRFQLLETLREYAGERLSEPRKTEVANRHAACFLQLAEQAVKPMRGPEVTLWLDRLEREQDNLRAALEWSLSRPDAEAGLRLAMALWRFWFIRGNTEEGLVWLERALQACPSAPVALRSAALGSAGNLAQNRKDLDRARHLHEQALTLRRSEGDKWGIAASLCGLGLVSKTEGDLEGARRLFEEGLALFREVGDERNSSLTLANLASTAIAQGDYAGGSSLYKECLELFRAAGDQQNIAQALSNLGHVSIQHGDEAAAGSLLAESLTLCLQMEHASNLAQCLDGFAFLAVRQERMERAGILLGAAEAMRERAGVRLSPKAQAEQKAACEAVREALSEAGFIAAHQQGLAFTLEEACAFAREGFVPPSD